MTVAASKEFIITTSAAGTSRTQFWDSSTPLALGHPFRWIVEKTDRGVRLRSLVANEAELFREVPLSEIQAGKAQLQLKTFAVQIRQVHKFPSAASLLASGVPINAPIFVDSKPASSVEENEWFQKALRYAAIGLVSFLILSWIWPKPDTNNAELIPPQFAKIVMTKPAQPAKQTMGGARAEAVPAAAVNAPKKVQETAVVQAFRAKALQSAISGLLKGGMTKLLAQSDFVMGNPTNHDARRIFDTRSDALKATAPDTGLMNAKDLKVGSLGGAGLPTTNGGKAIGYGKGEHAAVKGQGEAFVSMDIGGAAVEEGLTKDEVGEVIHRHLSEVRYCYESAMLRSPDIEGKLLVNFTIGGSGMVKSSEVKSSTLPDPRMDDCILRRLGTWKFPNTKGGIDVAVTYPFIFKTLGR